MKNDNQIPKISEVSNKILAQNSIKTTKVKVQTQNYLIIKIYCNRL